MPKSKALLSQALGDFVSLFFPDYCLGCSGSLVRGEKMICTRCMLEMPQTNYHYFPDNPLKLRMAGRIPLIHALSFFRFNKNGRIQHVLHALKYKNEPDVGVMLGRVYGEKLKDLALSFDLIVPVPLHPSRQRKRGYNQSAKFAQGLGESLEIPFREDVLIRSVKTATQTNKNKLKRWENVNDVFAIKDRGPIQSKHILLVDDVVTTGATLEACALVLTGHGCDRISIASIATA
jgi:ComF family protein